MGFKSDATSIYRWVSVVIKIKASRAEWQRNGDVAILKLEGIQNSL